MSKTTDKTAEVLGEILSECEEALGRRDFPSIVDAVIQLRVAYSEAIIRLAAVRAALGS